MLAMISRKLTEEPGIALRLITLAFSAKDRVHAAMHTSSHLVLAAWPAQTHMLKDTPQQLPPLLVAVQSRVITLITQ